MLFVFWLIAIESLIINSETQNLLEHDMKYNITVHWPNPDIYIVTASGNQLQFYLTVFLICEHLNTFITFYNQCKTLYIEMRCTFFIDGCQVPYFKWTISPFLHILHKCVSKLIMTKWHCMRDCLNDGFHSCVNAEIQCHHVFMLKFVDLLVISKMTIKAQWQQQLLTAIYSQKSLLRVQECHVNTTVYDNYKYYSIYLYI